MSNKIKAKLKNGKVKLIEHGKLIDCIPLSKKPKDIEIFAEEMLLKYGGKKKVTTKK